MEHDANLWRFDPILIKKNRFEIDNSKTYVRQLLSLLTASNFSPNPNTEIIN